MENNEKEFEQDFIDEFVHSGKVSEQERKAIREIYSELNPEQKPEWHKMRDEALKEIERVIEYRSRHTVSGMAGVYGVDNLNLHYIQMKQNEEIMKRLDGIEKRLDGQSRAKPKRRSDMKDKL
ncbi:MAG: hypothetical protein FWE47_00170 [Oscillospiraceae bacterium]|nr:hypothetical protein [Oscillospiraceae bacterium]